MVLGFGHAIVDGLRQDGRVPTYVAFLRAVNLGSRRKFPKDDLRAAVESTGASDVATYINTGNVVLTTRLRSRERVEAVLEEAFLADRGFEVPTIAFTAAELAGLTDAGDTVAAEFGAHERHAVLLLKDEPAPDLVDEVETGTDEVRTTVRGRSVHVLARTLVPGDLDPLGVGKRVGVATMRNHTVLRTITERWCR